MTPEVRDRIEKIWRGKVLEGYKSRKNAVIPQTWVCVALGDLGESKNGLNFHRDDEGYSIRVLGVGDFKDKTVIRSLEALEEVSLSAEPDSDYLLQNGDIVFVRSNGSKELVGRNLLVYPNDIKVSYSGFCIRYRMKDTKLTTPEYLNFLLDSGALKKKLQKENQGSNISNLNQDILSELIVVLPADRSEQSSILQILNLQDKGIELKEKRLAEKQRQKKYLMQQLLTGKKRLKGFNGEWKKTPLKKLLKERKTYSPKGAEYPHVTLSTEGIYAKSDRYDRDHLVKDEEKEYKITHKGDICYNPANLKFGAICINKFGDAIFSPIYVTFEVDGRVSSAFLSNYLMRWDFINAVRRYEEGTVYERMAVKPEDFLKFEIMLPSIEEQVAIAEILLVVDKEIDLLRQDLEQEKQKKKALMQLLLTGIVRVNGKEAAGSRFSTK